MPDSSAAPNRTLRLRIVKNYDAATVYCQGDLTAEVAGLLRNEVKPLIPDRKTVVLDLTGRRLMDSSGLGTIVKLYVTGRTSGCALSLINFNQRVRELLGLTNLLRIFEKCAEHSARIP
ncbi:MAG TPA: STAS domain-containing protein [Terriglobales bacterium]|nr:STAS domain-containing protein [Terriglobales bacterium]